MKKLTNNWLLLWIAIVVIGIVQPVFASAVYDSNSICKQIYKYSNLSRKLHNPKVYRNKKKYFEISKRLEEFILPFTILDEGKDKFMGLDIDGDGKDDEVLRNCGAGAGGLCSLYIKYSNGEQYISEEMGHFYLGHIDHNIYIVEETYGDISPYTDKDDTRIFFVSKGIIKEICNNK